MNSVRFIDYSIVRAIFIGIAVFSIILLFGACSEKYEINENVRLITKDAWIIDSYIDYSINREISLDPEICYFDEDGSLIKIKDNDTICGMWSMVDSRYMIMNGQCFKIADLSRRIMVLRYGKVDFIYKKSK